MYMLRIEHDVADFDGWKEAFDSDPADRKGSGVSRYRITRPVDDQRHVFIDLEFESEGQAAALLEKLRVIWARLDGTVMMNPRAHVVELIEETDV